MIMDLDRDLIVKQLSGKTVGRDVRLLDAGPSPNGAVAASALPRPLIPPREVPGYSFISSLALTDAIQAEGLAPAIKWPNDVLVGRRKGAGSLVGCARGGATRAPSPAAGSGCVGRGRCTKGACWASTARGTSSCATRAASAGGCSTGGALCPP